jgi:PAS domain S-box-containing protein
MDGFVRFFKRRKESTEQDQDSLEVNTGFERRSTFLRYLNHSWLLIGIITAVTLPLFPVQRSQFVFLIVVVFPTYLIVQLLLNSGWSRLAGLLFTLTVNASFYGLFLFLAGQMGAEKAFDTQMSVWMLMGLAVLFAGTFVDKWAAPALAFINTVLLIGTRLTLAPNVDPRPSAVVFWWMLALTIWLYERTLDEAIERVLEELSERKRAEVALRASEERLNYALTGTNDGLWDWNVQTDEAYFSLRWQAMIGYAEDELPNMYEAWESRLHPEDKPRVLSALQEHFDNGSHIYAPEFRMMTKAGEWIWIQARGRVVERDHQGRPWRMVGTHTDITERKRAEEALRESEERFRGLSEAAFEGILIHDRGVIIDANQALADLFGFDGPEDLIGKNGLEVLPFTAESLELIRTNMRFGSTEPLDIRVMKSDGSTFSAETQGRDITLSGRKLRVVTMRDITERKKAEEALRESEELYRTLAHNFPNGTVALFDRDLRYTLVDGTGLITFGTSKERLEGKTLWEVWPQDSQAEIEVLYRAVLNGQTMITERVANNRVYEARYVPVRNEQGEVYAGIVITQDISERKRAEEDREKFITELTAKNAELERFTYTVSHDLKSPLVTIKGFLGYLEQDAISGNVERLKGDTKRIANAVDKMSQLLDDLLELSRVGRLMNAPELIPFDEIVQDAIETVRGRLDLNGVTVRITASQDAQTSLPALYGDRQRLIEVLQNLLDNAAKYMGNQPHPRVEIGQYDEDAERGKPIFFVRDNGMGIAPEHHERIFGLFNKLDPTSEGTGIGLAIVKRIVEFHGGRVWVESEPGMGATFYFTLPEAQEKK